MARIKQMAQALTGSFLVLSSGAVSAQTRAKVVVNAGAVTGTLPATALGVNTVVADGALRDAALPPLLTQAGVSTLRFPAGSTADVYHWRTNSATKGASADINPGDTFDAFMDVARQVHAAPILTVNYGSNADGTGGGDPQEAASWVAYANHTKHYGVQFWEIGNEVYGNGVYKMPWEKDLHRDHSPTTYGLNALKFIAAMKAQDPVIKVGVSLVAPSTWPDGLLPDWNSGVLSVCGSRIDFVSVHWCPQAPGHEEDASLLASTSQIAGMTSRLRALITRYCGVNAPNVQMFVTKTAPVPYDPGPQSVGLVSALFLADDALTWLENGAAGVDWWDLHSGPVSMHGQGPYGDSGLFATGAGPESSADTPFPAFYGLEMVSGLGRAGDRLVSASSDQPLLAVHAVRRASDSLAVMLINKDPRRRLDAQVTVEGYKAGSEAVSYFYGQKSPAITSSSMKVKKGSTFTETLPPHSLTVVVMTPPVKAAPKPRPTNRRPQSRPRNNRSRSAGPRARRYPGGLIYVVP